MLVCRNYLPMSPSDAEITGRKPGVDGVDDLRSPLPPASRSSSMAFRIGMACDQDLAHRIREQLADEYGVTEKAMFGGPAFLLPAWQSVSPIAAS